MHEQTRGVSAQAFVRNNVLKHWQASRFRPARERLIERRDVLCAEREIAGRGIIRSMLRASRLRNRKYVRITRKIGKRDLAR